MIEEKVFDYIGKVKVYDEMPVGWKDIIGALTAPLGYKWICNGKSFFSKERETALLKIKRD